MILRRVPAERLGKPMYQNTSPTTGSTNCSWSLFGSPFAPGIRREPHEQIFLLPGAYHSLTWCILLWAASESASWRLHVAHAGVAVEAKLNWLPVGTRGPGTCALGTCYARDLGKARAIILRRNAECFYRIACLVRSDATAKGPGLWMEWSGYRYLSGTLVGRSRYARCETDIVNRNCRSTQLRSAP